MSASNFNGELERELRRLADIEAIRRLKYAYCSFNDGGWPEKGPSHMGATADLFVEDGVWDGRPVAPLSEGREAIRQMMIDYRGLSPLAVHNVFNPEIDVQGDTATGGWKAIVISTMKDGLRGSASNSGISFGEYRDEYVRTAEGWRFKKLRYIQIRYAPVDFAMSDPLRPPDR